LGFLDHSTNNVIIDAVLTDQGRKLLAGGLGNFTISKFAFADDEVDYTIIKKFGRTVGREKIEKNTPVLEAPTSGYLGLKFKNTSFNNNSMIRLPTLTISKGIDASGAASVTRSRTSSQIDTSISITAEQKLITGGVADHDVTNYSYQITLDHLFLRVQGYTPDYVDAYNNATYTIRAANSLSNQRCSSVTFSLVPNLLNDITFRQYSYTTQGTSIVTRPVSVTGLNDGQSVSFNINIY